MEKLICSILTTDSLGMSTSIGQCLLGAGLSYPLPGAPSTYTTVFAQVEASCLGVFKVFPPALAHSPEVTPSQLRAVH